MGRLHSLIAAVALATSSVLGLTACSSIVNPGSGSGSEETVSLTVYSNSVSDGRGDWLKEKAAEAGFNLNFVDAAGGDVYNRILAEKDAPVADIVFGLNDVYFNKLIAADTLEPYTPAWADKVKDDIEDTTGSYYPIVKEPIMLVCDSKQLAESEMPNDWPDLWNNEKFHGKYEVPSKLSGATTQLVLASILTPYADPNGKLGISDAGWKAVSEFFAHGVRAEEGTDLYAHMARGDLACGQMWLAGKVLREQQYEVTSEAAHPSTGVPMIHQGIAVIKGSKNQEAAHKFEDWFGGAELQAAWSKEFRTAPTNTDANAGGSQEAIEYTNSFAAQDIDWKFVAEHLDSWIEEIQLNYMK